MFEPTAESLQRTEKIFQTIQAYHQLNLSDCLREILSVKKMSLLELHQLLQDKGYYLNRESLYRYFNSSSKSNRFPSQDFIDAFADVLQLNEEESKSLFLFWRNCKLLKKYAFSIHDEN